MTLDISNALQKQDEAEKHRCIVRLHTTTWADSRWLHTKRSLTYLKRKCLGFNALQDDTSVIGAEYTIRRITNFNECKDGVYEAIVCNVGTDWETGLVDDWEYKLLSFTRSDK